MIEEPSFSFFLSLLEGGVGGGGGREADCRYWGRMEALWRRMNFRLGFNHTQTHAHVDACLDVICPGASSAVAIVAGSTLSLVTLRGPTHTHTHTNSTALQVVRHPPGGLICSEVAPLHHLRSRIMRPH